MKSSFLPKLTLAAALWLVVGNIAHAESHPDLARLQSYRSYFHMDVIGHSGHHYEVWYSIIDEHGFQRWSTVRAAIAEGDDPEMITKDDYIRIPRFVAGWLTPPDSMNEVPDELAEQKSGLETAIRRNHADAGVNEVRFNYLGEGIVAALYEVVPNTIAEDPYRRLGRHSTAYIFMNTETETILDQTFIGSGVSFIKLGGLFSDIITDPHWVDFALPEAIEGSSLLALGLQDDAYGLGDHKRTLSQLLQVVMQTTKRLEQGELLDRGLDKVLAKQSRSVLPRNFQQLLKFRLSIFGRIQPERDSELGPMEQYSQDIEFFLPVQLQSFSIEKIDPVSNIQFTLTGEFDSAADPALSMALYMLDSQTGKSDVLEFTSKVSNIGFKPAIICDNSSCATNGSLDLNTFENGQPVEDGDAVRFPGHSGYARFDVYTSSTTQSHPFTGVSMP